MQAVKGSLFISAEGASWQSVDADVPLAEGARWQLGEVTFTTHQMVWFPAGLAELLQHARHALRVARSLEHMFPTPRGHSPRRLARRAHARRLKRDR